MEIPELTPTALLLDNQLCFNLYAASRRVIQLYTPHLSRMNLTYTQYIALLVLWEHESLSIKELGEHLMLDSGTLTPLLKKMEQKGLVTRLRSSRDERRVLVQVTAQAQQLKQQALDFIPELLCASCLSPQEMVDLRELLKRLLQGLEENRSSSAADASFENIQRE